MAPSLWVCTVHCAVYIENGSSYTFGQYNNQNLLAAVVAATAEAADIFCFQFMNNIHIYNKRTAIATHHTFIFNAFLEIGEFSVWFWTLHENSKYLLDNFSS